MWLPPPGRRHPTRGWCHVDAAWVENMLTEHNPLTIGALTAAPASDQE